MNTTAYSPYDHALEAEVLGLMLQCPEAASSVLTLLPNEAAVFHDPGHQVIFHAFGALHAKNQVADLYSMLAWLEQHHSLKKAGDRVYVVSLFTNTIGTGLQATTHCLRLLDLHTKRRLSAIGRQLALQALAPDTDPHELIAQTQLLVNGLYASLQVQGPQRVGDIYDETIDDIVKAASSPGGITGVASGLSALDGITGGFQATDLIIVGGRPAMGKTSFTLAMARMAADNPDPCYFVSLEMSRKQLVKKLIATETGHSTSQLVRGAGISPEEAEALRTKAAALRELPLYIDDSPGLTVSTFKAKLTKAIREHGIKWAIIDYLQLMTGDKNGNREQEISSLTRGLKLVAKELHIPIVLLCQVSRGPETRGRGEDKRPLLSDLRESGAIEQDADIVLFPFRPEYYGIERDAEGQSLKGITEIIIAKYRTGPATTVFVQSDMETGKYQDLYTESIATLTPDYDW